MTAKLRELERRLAEEPDNLGVRVMLAGALREAGRHGDAVELYRSVAMAYRDQGRTQQSIAVCRSILEIAPDDDLCHALLAMMLPSASTAEDEPAPAGTGSAPHLPPPPEAARPRSKTSAPHLPPPPASARPHVVAPAPARVRTPSPAPRRPPSEPSDPGDDPGRRSSFDMTPLPAAIPHHVADPTAQLRRISESDRPLSESELPRLSEPELPRLSEPELPRLSESLLGEVTEVEDIELTEDDPSERLVTRQRPRVDSEQLAKLLSPASGNAAKLQDDGLDAVPGTADDEQTRPRDLPVGLRAFGLPRLPRSSPPPGPPPAPADPLEFAFFRPIPVEQRPAVLARFKRRSAAGGAPVIRRNEQSHAFVLVAAGRLALRAERADGQIVELGIVQPGEYIGEAALLARAPSPVQAVAIVDAELLLLAPHDFYEVAAAYPALWSALKDSAERRTREHDARMKR